MASLPRWIRTFISDHRFTTLHLMMTEASYNIRLTLSHYSRIFTRLSPKILRVCRTIRVILFSPSRDYTIPSNSSSTIHYTHFPTISIVVFVCLPHLRVCQAYACVARLRLNLSVHHFLVSVAILFGFSLPLGHSLAFVSSLYKYTVVPFLRGCCCLRRWFDWGGFLGALNVVSKKHVR